MRWQVPVVLILLLGPTLAGCIEAEDPVPVAQEGYGLVQIHVRTPLEIEEYPHLWSLRAVPRLVAFFAGDNDTRTRLNDTGYVDAAKGWDSWDAANQTAGSYPAAAAQDWMRRIGTWYEGEVPAGNYSLIRIELIELKATHVNGREIHVRAVGDRLSVGAPEGESFTVREGQTNTFVLHAMIVAKSEYDFEIR